MLPACIFALTLSASSLAAAALPAAMLDILNQQNVPPSSVAVVVMRPGATALISQNATLSMSPASTMKLVTSLVALEQLGPAFRWKTRILADAAPQKEILKGNLYLRGGGDPNLTAENFASMLRALRAQGIRKISGDVILDRSYFSPQRADLNAPQFDQNPNAYYNVIPDALLINSNISAITLSSGSDKIDARMQTPLDKIQFDNHLHFNDKPCSTWESELQPAVADLQRKEQIAISLSGGFPRHCQVTAYLNLIDRNQYIAHLLRGLWTEMGGSWQGRVRDGITPDQAVLLHERISDSLADTVRIINKSSDNAMARMVYLTLGAESLSKISTDSAAEAALRIRAWFAAHQIDATGLVLDNGSGLSRSERISATQLAALLGVAADSDWSAEFVSSLPIVALDGTMRKRLTGSAAAQRGRIKTGTLKDSTAIAGYVRDQDNQTWVVVAFINHDKAMAARAALDALIAAVVEGKTN
ncbi:MULTISPECIES: D-alanyl-D-alanine carboxypeptidase/D-alanyl-D-alanine-endopeptidase [unclassified Undibacterium]|uniref:D-alanyl-D-alanine carboxypeptidase/D-alanyl-D-alanine endopeptidase n=1 Tax=unclassified Undibacterium TaxID=2630295 RepID=UPI002AC966EB|nr:MULTISPECIES: D-alanyl-D-alanine carboxypeptidase/D-alanyl-D-alanine-endopeptidase [unclassified Undibacterium]MEB0139400.1 D-alanyl-D-alanine carboxypeptidase/D-alanyl-D-alanine-endopeptidase [Undibacterium sp. CCC2.1]MEB0173791.1 D-alanyl-D-alanine carboxypeptidase/D-alanyl-D-alanine-endopeptidase [Undibacterium sp. CCC1.1]MEB0177430.1 D-alanyl-D-alanine carboxypeptidase/D-alanyl-D-alanine-endopeptidase [Undibacterium sp. CCC3.4]MEB0216601.1 D-alanyl-D-alanine carboxypeptidase/D-alanyl-D-a